MTYKQFLKLLSNEIKKSGRVPDYIFVTPQQERDFFIGSNDKDENLLKSNSSDIVNFNGKDIKLFSLIWVDNIVFGYYAF